MTEIEKSLAIIQENQLTLADQVKETQKFLVKLAKNQHDITKRVTQWPFIAVEPREDL